MFKLSVFEPLSVNQGELILYSRCLDVTTRLQVAFGRIHQLISFELCLNRRLEGLLGMDISDDVRKDPVVYATSLRSRTGSRHC